MCMFDGKDIFSNDQLCYHDILLILHLYIIHILFTT